MATLINKATGEVEIVTDGKVAQQKWMSGDYSLAKSQPVYVKRADGQVGQVSHEYVQAELEAGAQLASDQDIQVAEDAAKYGDQTLAAAAVSAVNKGVTAGVLGAVASAVAPSVAKDIRKLEEYNPEASMAGEIGGALLTGGTAMMGKGGAGMLARMTPVGALSRIGESAAAKYGLGVAGALEGAAFGGLQEATESALQNRDLSAEGLAVSMGLGAALGGAMGAGITGLQKTVKNTKRGLQSLWARKTGAQMSDGIAEVIETEVNAAALPITQRATKLSAAGKQARKNILRGKQEVAKFTNDIRADLDSLDGLRRQLLGTLDSDVKYNKFAKLIDVEDIALAKSSADEAVGSLFTVIDDIADAPAVYGTTRSAVNSMRRDAEQFAALVQQLDQPGIKPIQAFEALDRMKRFVGKQTVKFQGKAPEVSEGLEKVYHQLRTNLEDTKIWGKAAEAQANMNRPASELIQNYKMFRGKFLTQSGTQDGFVTNYISDPAKVENFIQRIGVEKNEVHEQIFYRQLAAIEEFADSVSQYAAKSDIDTRAVKATAANIRKRLDDAASIMSDYNIYREHAQSKGVIGDLITGAATVAGGSVGGAVGGIEGYAAGRFLGKFASDPMARIKALSVLDEASNFFKERSKKSIQRVLSNKLTPRKVATPKIFAGGLAAGYEKISSQVLAASGSPETFMANVADATADVSEHAPETTAYSQQTLAKGVQVLAASLPSTSKALPTLWAPDKKIPPSDYEMQEFMDLYDILDDPMRVLDKLDEGTLTPKQVQAMKEVYPNVYNTIMETVIEEIADKNVSYNQKIKFSVLMGAPLEPTTQPEFIQAMQQAMVPAQPQQKPLTQGQAKPMQNIKSLYQTGSDDNLDQYNRR